MKIVFYIQSQKKFVVIFWLGHSLSTQIFFFLSMALEISRSYSLQDDEFVREQAIDEAQIKILSNWLRKNTN